MMHPITIAGGDMMLRGAIFDLDGTLLDSMPVWETLASGYLRSVGQTPPEGVDEAVRALSVPQTAGYFRRACGVPLPQEEIVAGIQGLIRRFYEAEARPKAGAEAFLRRLSRQGVRLCVATAGDAGLARAALQRCGLLELFEGIVDCGAAGAGKDQPQVYRCALALLGTTRGDTLVFEDALHALRTARADGFRTVAVRDDSEKHWQEMQALACHALVDYRDDQAFWRFADGL